MGKPTHAAVSASQAAALVSVIKSGEITDEDRADFVSKAAAIQWFTTDHCNIALESLAVPAAAGLKNESRRPLQDYTTLHLYGTEAFWERFVDASVPTTNKLQLLCKLTVDLGLRLPSAHTYKWMTSMVLVAGHTTHELDQMDAAQKAVFLKHTKQQFNILRKGVGDPVCFIEKLPLEPVAMARDYPLVFRNVFDGEALPIAKPPITLTTLAAVDQSFQCRTTLRSSGLGSASSSSGATVRQGPPLRLQLSPNRREDMGMERIATTVMSQMQAMAASQQRLMEMILAQQSTGVRSLKSMSAFAEPLALEDRRPAAFARQPTRLALPGPAAQPTDEGDPRVVELVCAEIEDGGGEDEGEPTAAGTLESLITALQLRKADQKAPTAAAKSAAAAATPPPSKRATSSVDVAPAELALQPPPKKAKSSSPSAATATPTKKAKASMTTAAKPSSPPTAKASSPSPAKPSSPSAAKASSPSAGTATPAKKAKVANKVAVVSKAAVAKKKADLKAVADPKAAARASVAKHGVPIVPKAGGFGCAKCRFSFGGCGQCRLPTFTGLVWNPFMP